MAADTAAQCHGPTCRRDLCRASWSHSLSAWHFSAHWCDLNMPSRTLLLLLVSVWALIALSDAARGLPNAPKWSRSSSSLSTPVWRRLPSHLSHKEMLTERTSPIRADSRRERRSEGLPGAQEGQTTTTTLILSKRMEGMDVLGLKRLDLQLDFKAIKSLTIPRDLDISRLLPIIKRVVAESELEEVEILQHIEGLDFSRQLSVKRLALTSSMLSMMPILTDLSDLALQNIEEAPVQVLERFGRVSRLSLVGEYYAVSRAASYFPYVEDKTLEFTSFNSALASSDATHKSRASSAGPSSLSFSLNDTWTNASLEAAVCGSDSSSVLTLAMTGISTKLFRFPTCISTWPVLIALTCNTCQMPNFTSVGEISTLTNIVLQSCMGTWSQSDSGAVSASDDNAGFFDWSWLSTLPQLSYVSITSSMANGTLPNEYTNAQLRTLYVPNSATPGNNLMGTIAPDFFSRFPNLAYLLLDGNSLSGTIPNTGLEKLESLSLQRNFFTDWPSLVTNSTAGFGVPTLLAVIDLESNNLVQIPQDSDLQSMTALIYFDVSLNPVLSGSVPNPFASSSTSRTVPITTYYVSGCSFSGGLPEISAYQVALFAASTTGPSFDFSGNFLTGPIPASWETLNMTALYLESNSGLNGALATQNSETGKITSQFIKSAVTLRLSGTGFTGPMFNITAMPTLTSLTMETPTVDLCSSARLASSQARIFPSVLSLSVCDLDTTNVSDCYWAYPAKCDPFAPPEAPTSTSNPCSSPSPGPSFTCSGGIWISYTSVTQETFSVPGTSTIIINGDLTTSSIVISSSHSTISATGCITSSDGTTPNVTLTLTETDVEEIVKSGGTLTTQLLHQSSSCSALSSSALTVDTTAVKKCKKIKTDAVGDSNGLVATFTLNGSGCNLWWIILASVLGGLVLIGVIVILVVFTVLSRKKRRANRAALEKSNRRQDAHS